MSILFRLFGLLFVVAGVAWLRHDPISGSTDLPNVVMGVIPANSIIKDTDELNIRNTDVDSFRRCCCCLYDRSVVLLVVVVESS